MNIFAYLPHYMHVVLLSQQKDYNKEEPGMRMAWFNAVEPCKFLFLVIIF